MIVASQRGPVSFRAEPDGTFTSRRGAGGVVSALLPLLAGQRDACWVAAAGSADDRAALHAGAATFDGLDLQLVDVDEQARRLQVDVVCNSTLWFLYHGLFDRVRRPRFDARFREAWTAYVAVNEQFAETIASAAAPRDAVIVNDYHLTLVPAMVRARRADLRVLHFAHTPFCGPNSIRVLPDDIAESLCGALSGVPAGFHTARWAAAYSASVNTVLGAPPAHAPFVAPLGPDREALEASRAEPAVAAAREALESNVGDRTLILRCDRIEPSKNLVRGFLAYDRLLELRPDLRDRVVFVARVYPSRQNLAEYLAYTNEVEHAVARVNARWGTPTWTPVVLDQRDDYSSTIAALERYDVLLVNPLRDGLNLVAKEGPLLNQRSGVVCLSRESGAFIELESAVEMVNPFDIEQTATALATAVDLDPAARPARAKALCELAASRTPRLWLDDLLAQL